MFLLLLNTPQFSYYVSLLHVSLPKKKSHILCSCLFTGFFQTQGLELSTLQI